MNKYKLTVPSTRLHNARTMTAAELKTVAQKELLEYTTFWETTMIPDMQHDTHLAAEMYNQALTVMTDLFGPHSKQVKYLTRNYNSGDNLVSRYYKQFAPPSTVSKWMDCAYDVAPEFVFGEQY
jgi:hypothetical protein